MGRIYYLKDREDDEEYDNFYKSVLKEDDIYIDAAQIFLNEQSFVYYDVVNESKVEIEKDCKIISGLAKEYNFYPNEIDLKTCIDTLTSEDLSDSILSLYFNSYYYKLLLIEDESEGITVAGFFLYSMRCGSKIKHLNLKFMFIKPKFRNMGIGTHCINFLKKGYILTHLTLMSSPDVVGFYEKLNFKKWEQLPEEQKEVFGGVDTVDETYTTNIALYCIF